MPARRKPADKVFTTVLNIRMNKTQADKVEQYCKDHKTNKTELFRSFIEKLH